MEENQYIGKNIKVEKPEPPQTDIDVNKSLEDAILTAAQTGNLKTDIFESFSSSAQTRETEYELIDTMAQDSTIAAALETYAEDITQANQNGDIFWAESNDSDIATYINYLLKKINVDKQAYPWALMLVKYGDVYVRLLRNSDFENSRLFNNKKQTNQSLREDVNLNISKDNDHYALTVEAVANPNEMFELTKFGKSMGYIKAATSVQKNYGSNNTSYFTTYNIRNKDVDIYSPTDFVHACLESSTTRTEEELDIFFNDDDYSNQTNAETFKVRRGAGILNDLFKVWRQLTLEENAVLLNRVTRSSVVRAIQMEVGDMPVNQVTNVTSKVKNLIEQKASLDVGKNMSEFTNPGPIENTIIIPTRNGKGALTINQIGGEVDPKQLTDLDWFNNKLFGGLKIPKQFFGWCLGKDTPVLLLNGEEHPIEYLYKNKDRYIGKGILSCDAEGNLVPSKIKNIILTNKHAPLLRVWLDNGNYVDVTPDHKMMLRDGSFIEAGSLKTGDSLMPYYERMVNGRRCVLNNKTGKFVPQFHIVAAAKGDVPQKGYNIHHIDSNKLNDDFDNLIKLTAAEHCDVHRLNLSETHKNANNKRRSLGEDVNANVGSRGITNGTYCLKLKKGDALPEGFTYGWYPVSEKTKTKMSSSRIRVLKEHPEYKRLGGFKKGEASPEVIQKMKEGHVRYFSSLSPEARASYRVKMQENGRKSAKKMHVGHMQKLIATNPDGVRYERSLRCPCCGAVFTKKLTNPEYKNYLEKKHYYYCSKAHEKAFNKGGKLARSYLLYVANPDTYEQARCSGAHRRDFFLKFENLKPYLPTLDEYVPEVNHRVVKIEALGNDNSVYDISVDNECHTFALPCGIFVHNCDDAGGFNAGTSLSQYSSRYGKAVKRMQQCLIEMVTDMINLILIDAGYPRYINQFHIKMQTPITQEEIDRKADLSNTLRNVSDVMNTLNDVQTPAAKLKILKLLLSQCLNEQEVSNILQQEIEKLEKEGEGEEKPEGEDVEAVDLGGSVENSGGSDFSPFDREMSEEPNNDETLEEIPTETPATETSEETTPEPANEPAEDNSLPSFADLGVDGTVNL